MPILQTLQHKASRGRLRKLSSVSLRGDARDQAAAAEERARAEPTPPLPCPQRTEYIADPPSKQQHLSAEPSSSFSPGSPASSAGSSPMEGFMFWRRRDPSPGQSSSHSRSSSADRKPIPILRRRSSKSAVDDNTPVHPPQTVRFPNNSPCAKRTSTLPGYNAPPSAYSRSQPGASTPSPQPSPAGSRTGPLPPSPANSSPAPNSSAATSSPHPSHSSGSTLRTSYHAVSPMQQHSPAQGSGSGSSPMSRASVVSRSSYASASYNSPASTHAQLPPATQAYVPVTPPAQIARPPGAPVQQQPAHTANRRSSRPLSSINMLNQQPTTPRAAVTVVPVRVRPSSVMSNNSTMSRNRRSSRPQASSSSRTRMSIASISTYTSSTGHGSSSPGRLSPATTVTPPAEPSSGSIPRDQRATSYNGHSNGAFEFPSRASPAPATPPRQCSLELADAKTPVVGEDVAPMFNVIPATPQKEGEQGEEYQPAVVEPPKAHVRRRSRSASPSIRTLEDMPEEEEEEEAAAKSAHQHFMAGLAGDRSPMLDQVEVDRSPIGLQLTQLDDIEGDLDSDSETEESNKFGTAEEMCPPSSLGPSMADESVAAPAVAATTPPPRMPKSPKRENASLYQSPHDDGRSISRSLAELAALACDLPPLGEELTQQASAASQRLAAARSAADASAYAAAEFVRQNRPVSAPIAAPTRPLPVPTAAEKAEVEAEEVAEAEQAAAAPQESAPVQETAVSVSAPEDKSEWMPQMAAAAPVWMPHHTAQVPSDPLPPSPPFMSYGSLPSLMSNGSMPSSASESLPSSLSHGSIMSAPASPDAEEALGSMLRQLSMTDAAGILQAGHALHAATFSTAVTTPKGPASHLPDAPQMYSGLGLGLDVKSLAPSAFEATTPTSERPIFALPSPPQERSNRMSVAPAGHPHRAALYGTPQLLVEGQRASFASADSVSTGYTAATHTPHGSISSLVSSDDYEESVLHHAEIVAVSPYAQAYVVGRDDARTHEVGVAF